jgi:acyl-CoA thioester hydrolase
MTTSFDLTVRYAETDAQGVVHHANYLIWFEEGRSDHLRQRGLNYSDIERSGYFVVVAEARVQYKAPAFYEDRITIETTLQRARGKILEFTYRALNQAGLLLVEGRTLHVVLGADRRPASLPAEVLAKISLTSGR